MAMGLLLDAAFHAATYGRAIRVTSANIARQEII
jgi:hypothetical protein